MCDTTTQQQLQRLADLGVLSRSQPGHVLECHVNGDEIGWHFLRKTSDFVKLWPQRPKLIPEASSDKPFVALFSEIGIQVFEYENATACGVAK